MWGCQWNPRDFDEETEMPKILEIDTEDTLLDGVERGDLFGFLNCDIETPANVIEDMDGFLFPPIIRHETITEEYLSDYMKNKIKEQGRTLSGSTVVQCYNAKQQFISTGLARFYLKMGMKISNISTFVQYIPAKGLAPFCKQCVDMRVEATIEGDPTKQNTAKYFGNSGKLPNTPLVPYFYSFFTFAFFANF